MPSKTRFTTYDALDSYYEDCNGGSYEMAMAVLEKLLLQHIPKGVQVLDLCCGRGKVAQLLQMKGYQLTGIDGSEVMLSHARKNVPCAEFILGDARFFELPPTFHAAYTTDLPLSHITSIEELKSVFQNVYMALLEKGLFMFDLLVKEQVQLYKEEFQLLDDTPVQHSNKVEDDYVGAAYSIYGPESRVWNVTQFHLIKGEWQRSDVTSVLKIYSRAEVQSALEAAGFQEVRLYDLERDFEFGKFGIICFVGRKP